MISILYNRLRTYIIVWCKGRAFSVTFVAEYDSSCQLGGYICNCVHSNWSPATFHASNWKQRKWVNCEVHGKSLTNNRIPRTTPRNYHLTNSHLALYPYPKKHDTTSNSY